MKDEVDAKIRFLATQEALKKSEEGNQEQLRLLRKRMEDEFSTKENVIEKVKTLQSLVKNTYVTQLSQQHWLEGHNKRE